MNIIAIDLSFSNTGISIFANGDFFFKEFKVSKPKIGKRGSKKGKVLKSRINDIEVLYNELNFLKIIYAPDKVLILDNYSKGAKVTKSLAKLQGVCELVFGVENIEYFTDNEVRAFLGLNKKIKTAIDLLNWDATDNEKYNARKKVITNFFYEDFQKGASDDIADSYVLLKFYLTKFLQ